MNTSYLGRLAFSSLVTFGLTLGCGSSKVPQAVQGTKKSDDSKVADGSKTPLDPASGPAVVPVTDPAVGTPGTGTAGTTLVGAWQSNCVPSSSGTNYASLHAVFDATTENETIAYFADAACTIPQFKIEIKASYVATPMSPFTNIDITINSASFNIVDPNVASSYNSQRVCSRSDWAVGKIVDISMCQDLNSDKPGTKYYTNYLIESAQLYLGSTSGGSGKSAAARPATVDKTLVYKPATS